MGEQFECDECSSVYPSVKAALLCCDKETDARYELGNN